MTARKRAVERIYNQYMEPLAEHMAFSEQHRRAKGQEVMWHRQPVEEQLRWCQRAKAALSYLLALDAHTTFARIIRQENRRKTKEAP
jgi:hypothetical protein